MNVALDWGGLRSFPMGPTPKQTFQVQEGWTQQSMSELVSSCFPKCSISMSDGSMSPWACKEGAPTSVLLFPNCLLTSTTKASCFNFF